MVKYQSFIIDILKSQKMLQTNKNIYTNYDIDNKKFERLSEDIFGIGQSISDMLFITDFFLRLSDTCLKLVSKNNEIYKQILIMSFVSKYSTAKVCKLLHLTERNYFFYLKKAKDLYINYFFKLLISKAVGFKNSDNNISYKSFFKNCFRGDMYNEKIVEESMSGLSKMKNGIDKCALIRIAIEGKSFYKIEQFYKSTTRNKNYKAVIKEAKKEFATVYFGINIIAVSNGVTLIKEEKSTSFIA